MEQNVCLNSQSGFTLIEFCVAVLIMMVGLLGLLQAVNLASEQNLGTIIRNEAVFLADEQAILAKATESTLSGFVHVDQGVTTTSVSTVSRKIRSGTFNFTVNRSDTGKSAKSKEVVIQVTWNYRNKSLNHQISSLIIEPVN